MKRRYCRTLVGGRKLRKIISRKNSGVALIGKIFAGTLDRKSLTEEFKSNNSGRSIGGANLDEALSGNNAGEALLGRKQYRRSI
jgi:hypothetical protein